MSVPVIAGFFPDPTVCRVGDDYYLACSSFEYSPGVPLLHSRDLRRWEHIGNILDRVDAAEPSQGIYAPTLRHHDGRFWIITTDASRIRDGHLITHAERPEGPWSDPVYVAGTLGIDPDLAWDDAGNCYLTYASFQEGGGIVQVLVDPGTGKTLGDTRLVWRGTGMTNVEAPHLYQIDGVWYLVVAEGGTERGHAVTIARGPAPDGPFESCPGNPILSHRSTGHPVQNTGHADLVQSADGTWWAVYLGVRPHGFTPHFHVNGRETFLAAVTWTDGWPAFHEPSPPVTPIDHSFTDDFTGPVPHPRWVTPGRDLTCVRVRDARWHAEAVIDPDAGPARFVLRLDDRHWYGLVAEPGRISAVARIGDLEQEVGSVPVTAGPVTLRIAAVDPANLGAMSVTVGPDDIVLTVGDTELARLDGRYLSTEVGGGFTGRVLGVGPGRPDLFTYTSIQP
ncbi:glycoside hydrolase family 43 protein [Actinoplanes couchii]|uniref:Glycoside hydrolase 43 family protein n=1 Tax=Actinoplanes couchii TaxID=403638 RepID=A0ABQ3XDX7_9ACTN|nr:glycoside hydrolase family 43 protein [Actinoplanes couchii]MDR6317196.1 beta-xylosidase [Actinoplanes couchii]GID56689.1 glycoside hydrolase 43 family protein [Actinoplanes couchii]